MTVFSMILIKYMVSMGGSGEEGYLWREFGVMEECCRGI